MPHPQQITVGCGHVLAILVLSGLCWLLIGLAVYGLWRLL